MDDKNSKNSAAEILRRIAFAVLLACAVGRAFITELPFQTNPINFATLTSQSHAKEQPGPAADRTELARVTFALILLAVFAAWLLAGAIEGNLQVKFPWLGAVMLLFVMLSFLSVFAASDKRAAWNAWLEQTALLSAAFTAIQLCRSRTRFVMLVVVLAALGVTLAIKAIYQRVDEIPTRIAFFEANREQNLADRGIEPGDPKEKMLESRIRDTTVTGFFGLANLFAAELLLLLGAAVGLAGAKIFYARKSRDSQQDIRDKTPQPHKPGEISTPTLSACLAVFVAAAIIVALLMTKSRGGIGGACIVGMVTTLLVIFRKRLTKRWRLVAVSIFAVFILSLAGIAGYGLTKDRLPSKTMTMRWFYWTGSADIVAQQPLLGVGPGNFPHAYMAVRRAQAEEEVKTPHNFIAHALTQFGLPGGTVYIVILGIFLVAGGRPGLGISQNAPPTDTQNLKPKTKQKTPGRQPRSMSAEVWWTFILIIATTCFTRWIVIAGGSETNIAYVILDCIIPAIMLAVMLATTAWFGGLSGLGQLPDKSIAVMRIALAAGAVAFVIHNLVSFGLWAAGTATTFWIVAGAAAGAGSGGKFLNIDRLRWPVFAAVGLVLIIAGYTLAGPVYRRSMYTENFAKAIAGRNLSRAQASARSAASADPLDVYAQMNLAKFMSIASTKMTRQEELQSALDEAVRATQINPQSSAAARLAGLIAQKLASTYPDVQAISQAVQYFARAVELDPKNARLRLEYAGVLKMARDNERAMQQIDIAEELNRKLAEFDPTSSSKFGQKEQNEIRKLRKGK